MEIYETVTLGKTTRFVIKKNDEDYGVEKEKAVIVTPSLLSDFKLEYNENEHFLPDLLRSFELFLARVRGYPKAEYEIELPRRIEKIWLKDSLFGGKIGKCKVLCTNEHFCIKKCDLSVSYVLYENEIYALILCDSIEDFCIKNLSYILSKSGGKYPYPKAVGVISVGSDGARIVFLDRDGGTSPTSLAYASAFALINELFGIDRMTFREKAADVNVCSLFGEISVTVTGGSVSRIYT